MTTTESIRKNPMPVASRMAFNIRCEHCGKWAEEVTIDPQPEADGFLLLIVCHGERTGLLLPYETVAHKPNLEFNLVAFSTGKGASMALPFTPENPNGLYQEEPNPIEPNERKRSYDL